MKAQRKRCTSCTTWILTNSINIFAYEVERNFKDSNDWNEKSILGASFAVMVVVMALDLLTGAFGSDPASMKGIQLFRVCDHRLFWNRRS